MSKDLIRIRPSIKPGLNIQDPDQTQFFLEGRIKPNRIHNPADKDLEISRKTFLCVQAKSKLRLRMAI